MIRWLYFKYGLAIMFEGFIVAITLGYLNPQWGLNSAKNISRYRHKYNYNGR